MLRMRGVPGDLLAQPAFFAARFYVEEDQEYSRVDQGQPSVDRERPAERCERCARVHGVAHEPVRPARDQRGSLLWAGRGGEVAPERGHPGYDQGAAKHDQDDATDQRQPRSGPGRQTRSGARAQGNQRHEKQL